MKILIAGDNARFRQMLKQVIAGFARALYVAGDGGEALNVHPAQRPDWG